MPAFKPEIVIIGSGKLAYSLVPLLLRAGFPVDSIISRSKKSAKTLANKFAVKNYSSDFNSFHKNSHLFFIAVPDDTIWEVSENLALLNLQFNKCIFVHTSGVKSSDELVHLKRKGAQTASVHIMQSFPSRKTYNLKDTFTVIESKSIKTKKLLSEILIKAGLHPVIMSGKEKILNHLSGVFASNFMAGNFFAAEKILAGANKHIRAKESLKSISESTLSNILKTGAAKNLSGPVERGDSGTITNHLLALDSLYKKKPGKTLNLIKASYIIQSLLLIETALEKNGAINEGHEKIRAALRKELKKIIGDI